MQFSNLQMKRHFIAGKIIVGIDPSKEKSDAAVIDAFGLLQGKTFSFQNNHEGFQKQLFNCLNERIVNLSKENTIFAIEAACNLWQKLADYLISLPAVVYMNQLVESGALNLKFQSKARYRPKIMDVVLN